MKIESKYIDCIKTEVDFSIGGNAAENFDIIDAAEPTDLWFHIENESSCHVIAHLPNDIKLNKKQTNKIIKQGAVLCKQYSRYANQLNVNVIYTKIENVTKTDKVGAVIAVNTKLETI